MLSVGGKAIVKSNHIVKTRLGNNINLHLVSSKKIVKSKFIVKSRFVKSNLDCIQPPDDKRSTSVCFIKVQNDIAIRFTA